MKGWVITRDAVDGTRRYDACWRSGTRKKSRTFQRRKDAEHFLAAIVKLVHEGGYVDVKPLLMDKVFDQWLAGALEVRVREGSLKLSTARSYRSMVEEHLRPAFGHYRSDRLALAAIEEWRAGIAERIAADSIAGKTFQNLRNLLHSITNWARHPARAYLTHDPLGGLPRIRLPRAKKRMHFEPDQVAAILAIAARTPPDDTVIRVAALSGVRRSELFGLQWEDVVAGEEGGQLHIRRRLYQGDIDTPKTEQSDRAVDVPVRLLDELAIYRVMHPPIGQGYIFRTASGAPLDPDNWHHRRLVPILKQAGLYRRGTGLHSIRHGYVSLLAHQGADIHYISSQVGHSSVRLTQDIYRHVFAKTRVEAMRRLNDAIPSGKNPAESAGASETDTNSMGAEPQ